MSDIYKMHASVEWYTPESILDVCRSVTGRFALDVASDVVANETVKASRFFLIEDDALNKDWVGPYWCNPPYDRSGIQWEFVKKAANYASSVEGFVLVKAAVETKGFEPLYNADALCFISSRVYFGLRTAKGVKWDYGPARWPSALAYFGPKREKARQALSKLGTVVAKV